MDCYYVMKADTEDRILIEVLDVDMEAQLFRSCLDFVGFHEASTPKHFMRPYLSFCGQLKYRQVTSKTDSVTIQFFSDELVEGRGVRISYEAVSYGMCETNWLHRNDGTCYRYLEANPKLGWADAQDQCSQMQANLAVVRNQQDLEYMSKSFGHFRINSWIGHTDADQEGVLSSIDSEPSVTHWIPALTSNDDGRDCLYLDLSHSEEEPYHMVDCRSKLTFICQKHSNWSTVVLGPQHQRVRKGSAVVFADLTVWFLIFMVLILIAAIAVFICQACFKQRDQNRVHIAESSRLVRDSERRMAKPGSSTVNHCQGASGFEQEANPSLAQMSSLHATMHYNQAEVASSMPREPVNGSDLQRSHTRHRKDENHSSTPSASAKPPRVLSPLPLRETMSRSINTRDRSFLRSRRTNELFDRPNMKVLHNVSAISLDEFWNNTKD
nr:CUB and C-type lectin domain containing protein [Haemonchus contortus]